MFTGADIRMLCSIRSISGSCIADRIDYRVLDARVVSIQRPSRHRCSVAPSFLLGSWCARPCWHRDAADRSWSCRNRTPSTWWLVASNCNSAWNQLHVRCVDPVASVSRCKRSFNNLRGTCNCRINMRPYLHVPMGACEAQSVLWTPQPLEYILLSRCLASALSEGRLAAQTPFKGCLNTFCKTCSGRPSFCRPTSQGPVFIDLSAFFRRQSGSSAFLQYYVSLNKRHQTATGPVRAAWVLRLRFWIFLARCAAATALSCSLLLPQCFHGKPNAKGRPFGRLLTNLYN